MKRYQMLWETFKYRAQKFYRTASVTRSPVLLQHRFSIQIEIHSQKLLNIIRA